MTHEIKFKHTRELVKAAANELITVLRSRDIAVDDQVRVGRAITVLLSLQDELPSGEPQPWIGG